MAKTDGPKGPQTQNPDAIAEAEKALNGGGTATLNPPSSRSELTRLAAEKSRPSRRVMLNDDIIYVLGAQSDRAGEFRAAKTSYVQSDGATVNLVWLMGRADDAPKGLAMLKQRKAVPHSYFAPGIEYDPTGKPGTWHFMDDDVEERPIGKKSRTEMAASR